MTPNGTHIPLNQIWLDLDAGIDDAQGLMLSLAWPGTNVIGVSCVAGNTDLPQVGRNVARVLHVCNRDDVPFYLGAAKSILGGDMSACYFHGEDGLGDCTDMPHSSACPDPGSGSAVVHLIDAVSAHPKEVTVIACGPLTNIALACRIDPEFPSKVGRLVVMGGASKSQGNTTATAEYNFVFDPEAAYICLKSFEVTTLLTWELMLACALDWEWVDQWTSTPSKTSQFLRGILRNMSTSEQESGNKFIACDPVAVAAAINPHIVKTSKLVHVDVELQGRLTRGQSVVDWDCRLNARKNVELVEEIDIELFKSMMNCITLA